MKRRERASWIGLDLEPSLEEKRFDRALSRISLVVLVTTWAALCGAALWHCGGLS